MYIASWFIIPFFSAGGNEGLFENCLEKLHLIDFLFVMSYNKIGNLSDFDQ